MSHSQRTVKTTLAVLAAMLAMAGGVGAGEVAKGKGEASAKGLALDFIPGEKDRATYKVLQQTLEEDKEGVWQHLRERGVVYLSPQEAVLRALRNNLTLKVGSAEAAKAALAVQQAEAIFDPTFVVDVGRSYSTTFSRKGFGPVYNRDFHALVNGNPYLDLPNPVDPTDGKAEITRIGYLDQNGGFAGNKEFFYSKAPKKGPNESYSGSVAVTQQLPWGPQLRLTHGINYRLVNYDDLGHSYDVPYSTSFALNLLLPLPGMKNFGKFAPQEVQQQQAKLTRDRGDLALRALIENTLLEVDLSYWSLVQSLENLMAAIDNRKAAQEQASTATRMLDLGRTTQYGKNQRDAELARTRVAEEAARDNLINASYALALVLEVGRDVTNSSVILPAGYQDRLASEMVVDGKTAHKTAQERRYELKIGAVDIASRLWNLRLMENQALPDVTLNASFSQAQDNSTYGYGSYVSSLTSINKPDSRSYSTAMSYIRPVGNRAAVAAVEQARSGTVQTEISLESAQKDVTKEVDDALANLSSARLRKAAAKRSEELAELTLSKLRSRAENTGDVTDLELTLKLRDVLQARTSRILAQMDAKKAETRLLAAQGILAESMAEKTAIDEFDRYRVQLLAESKAVPFFSAFSFGKSETAQP